MEKRCSFELFKSNVCHWLKEEGDIDFLIQVLESDLIRKYYLVTANTDILPMPHHATVFSSLHLYKLMLF